jgi:predicted nucleic acid-binding protein
LWVAGVDRFALCPVVEGALVRFVVRLGESADTAAAITRRLQEMPTCDFWPDSISYTQVDLSLVRGHRQVTDAYLVSLARAQDARLATMDEALARAVPEHTLLLPQ